MAMVMMMYYVEKRRRSNDIWISYFMIYWLLSYHTAEINYAYDDDDD